MDVGSITTHVLPTAIIACVYALLCLGLNIQWGEAGLGNLGVAGFYALGAYTSAWLTVPQTPHHLGGFALPVPLGMLGAVLVVGIVAYGLGCLTLHRHEDALPVVSFGLAEILRLTLHRATWWSDGMQGVCGIPRPLVQVLPRHHNVAYLGLMLVSVLVVYSACERLRRAPWGRLSRAIRDDAVAAASVGKDVEHVKRQNLLVGALVMGLGGSLYAHYAMCIHPDAFNPFMGTWLVWMMLIVGGGGNSRRAIIGALGIWGVWSLSEAITGLLPLSLHAQALALRVILVVVLMQIMLMRRPQGVTPPLT